MADLDDFFAKKDRKKKIGKKGFSKANTEILAKTLEENEKKEQRAEEKAAPMLATSEANRAGNLETEDTGNEDEWKAYEDTMKDYSNLKIETLVVEDEPENEEEAEHEINEEGEKVKKNDGGPWNKLQIQLTHNDNECISDKASEVNNDDKKEEIALPRGSVAGGLYVVPHLRGSGGVERQQSSVNSRMMDRRGVKKAPAIDSQVHFPSLSSANANDAEMGMLRKSDREEFEEVKFGSGTGRTTTNLTPKRISLDNKFSALRGNN